MTAPLSDEEITLALKDLGAWTLQDDKLMRTYRFGSFKEALSFIVRVGLHAEEAAHHPEIHNLYGTVTLTLCTHDAGDKVTRKDVDLARAIESFSWVD